MIISLLKIKKLKNTMKTNNYIIDFLIDTYNTNNIDDSDIKNIIIEHETSLLKFKEKLNIETFKKIESIIRLREYSKFEEYSKSERRKFFDKFIEQLDKYEKIKSKNEDDPLYIPISEFNDTNDFDKTQKIDKSDMVYIYDKNIRPQIIPDYNPFEDSNHPLYDPNSESTTKMQDYVNDQIIGDYNTSIHDDNLKKKMNYLEQEQINHVKPF